MIADRIKKSISSGVIIPKPEADGNFTVKAWGVRRGEHALIYCIPNHSNPLKPYEKGITESEFEKAFTQIQNSGELTRAWFNKNLPSCASEGGCNFTTIGGIFELLGEAVYLSRGIYQK